MAANRSAISTHILDTSIGQPAIGVEITLSKLVDGNWMSINTSATNSDGRCGDLMEKQAFSAGVYKFHFDTGKYFASINSPSIYPFIEITFECASADQHYHIPLLLNPFGYTTYRGT